VSTAAGPTPNLRDGEAVMRCRDLAIDYAVRRGVVSAVRDVSFDLRVGETLALVGESGCGKSTVAFSLIGFLGRNGRIAGGSIEFLGRDITTMGERELRSIRGKNISMVYQDPTSALNPSMRIGKQLQEILTEHDEISDKAAFDRCVEMLERVHMPDARSMMRRYPHQLSGGQQQRVIIAGALLNRPALLIMDEPTTGLDVTVEATVLDLVEEIKRDFETAVLFITHDLGVVARIADRVAVMYAGEIVELGAVDAMYQAPRHPYTQGLLACIPRGFSSVEGARLQSIPGVVPAPGALPPGCAFAPRCSFRDNLCSQHPELRDSEPGRVVRCHYAEEIAQGVKQPGGAEDAVAAPAAAMTHPELGNILTVADLRTYYEYAARSLPGLLGFDKRHLQAVDGVDLSLRAGETLGIVGESGSGKSTLAKTIMGLEPISGGKIDFMGLELTAPVGKRSRHTLKMLQMIFQNPDSTLNPTFRVGDTISRSVIKLTDTPRRAVRARVIELLESVKLGESYYERYPRQLSGGEKQRVAIAAALAGNPNLIVADEPTSALDVSVQAAVLNLLQEIQAENRTAYILISHDLSVVRYLADHVAVMYLGHIVDYGPAVEIFKPPYHPYTEALLSAIPVPDATTESKRVRLSAEIPSAMHPPAGCVFHTRCPHYIGEICHTPPPLRTIGSGRVIACHHSAEYLAALQSVYEPA
jgi:peptide/nickel transport system ATP-binding protein